MPKTNDPTQEPFVNYNLKKKADTFTVKLNRDERELLEKCKYVLEQNKDSTALKTLAWYGAKVLLSDSNTYLLSILFKNKRNNKRLGIIDFD